MRALVGLVVASGVASWVASCAGSFDGQTPTDAPTGIGDAGGCDINLIFDPAVPFKGDHVKVTARAIRARRQTPSARRPP